MAAEVSNMSVNGGYDQHHGYGNMDAQQSYNAYATNATSSQPASHTAAAPSTSSTTTGQASDIPKDEVGWYFVERYYTTLSRNPEKLYLFYNKRSQFVSGQETDKVAVCVGQRAINDRIKELDFQDCKVRVTNVDSQASDSNIVIQVIGEISNKSQPHKKFTQTFVLATQTNGYFVLNDIFRYLIDEEPEDQPIAPTEDIQQAVPAAESGYADASFDHEQHEPRTLTNSSDPTAIEHDAAKLDDKLEGMALAEPAKTEESTEVSVDGAHTAQEPVAQAQESAVAAPVTLNHTSAEEADLAVEKPKDPEPSPVPSPPKQATPQPAPIPKPAVPKTWASLAASANKSGVTANSAPVAAAPPTKPAPQSTKAPVPNASVAVPSVPSGPASQREASPATAAAPEQDEWTSVGTNHGRQQSRQAVYPPHEPSPHRGYIKNVHEGIDGLALKASIEKHAEVTYFDIARQKNCAFVDFKTAEGYNAVIKANPFTINNEQLFVEERLIRPGSTPYVPRGQYQGRGRGNNHQGPPRGNFQGRGNYVPRGRGGASTPRGRGGAQAV